MKRFFFCIALVSALLAYAPAFAAINVYLKLDGIEGESKDEAHQGWIDLSSFQFGATGPHIGPAGGDHERVSFSDFTFTKFVDKSSPGLLFDTASATPIKDATIDVVKPGTDKSKAFLEYKLSNVLISSYSTSGGSDDNRPTESVSMSYAEIQMEYFPQKNGTFDNPVFMEWDILRNQGRWSGVASVPESSSWAMLAVGLLMMALRGRKMMQSSSR